MKVITSLNDRGWSWVSVVLLALGIWLGGSLVVSLVVMPALYATGMMAESSFAATGYTLFWLLNRFELLCASVVLTGILVLAQNAGMLGGRRAIALAALLLAIPLLDTYVLTPEMTALGAQLDVLGDRLTVPSAMTWLHGGYWLLELAKFSLGVWLFRHLFRQVDPIHDLSPQ